MTTFALVHGAWHGGWRFAQLERELEARGRRTVAPDLPSARDGEAAPAAAAQLRPQAAKPRREPCPLDRLPAARSAYVLRGLAA